MSVSETFTFFGLPLFLGTVYVSILSKIEELSYFFFFPFFFPFFAIGDDAFVTPTIASVKISKSNSSLILFDYSILFSTYFSNSG